MVTLARSRLALARWQGATTTRSSAFQRHFSSLDEDEEEEKGIGDVNVDGLISGVTTEMARNDPVLAAFIRANFPDKFYTHEELTGGQITNWGELRRTAPKPPLNIRSLASLVRSQEQEEGSNRCFSMRREGFIPGLIYGGDPTQGITGRDREARVFVKTPSSTIQSEIDRYRHSFASRVYDVTVYENEEQMEAGEGGMQHRVMPRDIQQHPVNDLVYCCNFLRYFPGRSIKIPLTLINEEESPALKRDGYLIPINKFCEVTVEEGVDIPEELEVECTGVKFKEVIRLDRIAFPDGVKPSKKVLKHKDWMVGPIHGGKGGAEEVVEEEEE